ncbi:MAG: LamG domain-containing protein, partial [Thermoplasmata archaeon]|nr:LamG domain-containing protein [Thermoplasmata archaeon]
MRKVFTIAVALALILITFASMFNINVIAEDGLIAKWSFDEGAGTDATDTSGNGNDGIIYGATWATGINGSALSFDGVDDYVEVPDDPSLRGFNQITLEAWVNIKSVYIYDEGEDIVGKGDDLTKDVYNLHVREDPAQNSLEFKITIGDGVNRATVASSYIFETNTNYSVVGTYDGNILSIYVNGILINDLEVSIQTFGNNLNPLYIGKHTWGASESKRIEGMIDEVKIYNYALSATEI